MEIWSLILACEGLDNEALVKNKYVIQREQTLDYSFLIWRHAFHTSWLSNLVEECCLWAVSSLIELFLLDFLPQSKPWLLETLWPSTSWRVGGCSFLHGFASLDTLEKKLHEFSIWSEPAAFFKKHTGCFICSSSLIITFIIRYQNTPLQYSYIAERLRTPASPMGVSINSRSSKRRILLVHRGRVLFTPFTAYYLHVLLCT